MKNEWLKNRGYPHLSDKVNLSRDRRKILSKVLNNTFVAQYAFYPLIHSVIKERRYKKINSSSIRRYHSYKDESNNVKRSIKNRPLHYASHLDAIIFGYYSDILLKLYEEQLKKHSSLSECIIAYRKIPIPGSEKNKSTINFAHEAFMEILKYTNNEKDCIVLKFDIESYFSTIDHKLLKQSWANLLGLKCLPKDHYNVFKAATTFSYILKDDLRISSINNKRRSGFNEKRLARLRKKGIQSFFESASDFRSLVTDKSIKIYKYPFRNEGKVPIGIPQGLPISATLANLYLLSFDKKVLDELVNRLNVYYRRYSDDIIVICRPEQVDFVENYIKKSIEENKIKISESKTEKFLFRRISNRLVSIKISQDRCIQGVPFTYLGFEFYGDKMLIKSANLAKFYRRMIYSVKRKVKRAVSRAKESPHKKIIIFKRQLYKLYTSYPLSNTKLRTKAKWLIKNERGEYRYTTKLVEKKYNSNYLSYVNRASDIMNEPAIKAQIKKHYKIFNDAIYKHLSRAKDNLR